MKNLLGSLEVTKDDLITGNSARVDESYMHGDASIAGTQYILYADERITNVEGTVTYFEKNEELATYTFDKEGVATIKITNAKTAADLKVNGVSLDGIPMGTYRIQGIKDSRTDMLQTKQYINIHLHIKICLRV